MLKFQLWSPKLAEQIKVEPNVALGKDLLEENIDGHVIYFCNEATRIAKYNKEENIDPLLACPLSQLK